MRELRKKLKLLLWRCVTVTTGTLVFKIQRSKPQKLRIVSELTYSHIAPLTQYAANKPGFVIMIYC